MQLILGRAISTAAVAVGLTLATAGTAFAQDLTVADPAGDVHAYPMDSETGVPEPTVTNGDITRTVFRHLKNQITVRVKFRDLRRAGDARVDVFRIVTDAGVRRDVAVVAGPAPVGWGGRAQMTKPNGKTVACSITHKIDYDTNVVTIGFPRSCVSNPRWVRVGFFSGRVTGGWKTVHLDDAQVKGASNPNAPKVSAAKLRRG